jgi:hypothetical protein
VEGDWLGVRGGPVGGLRGRATEPGPLVECLSRLEVIRHLQDEVLAVGCRPVRDLLQQRPRDTRRRADGATNSRLTSATACPAELADSCHSTTCPATATSVLPATHAPTVPAGVSHPAGSAGQFVGYPLVR